MRSTAGVMDGRARPSLTEWMMGTHHTYSRCTAHERAIVSQRILDNDQENTEIKQIESF